MDMGSPVIRVMAEERSHPAKAVQHTCILRTDADDSASSVIASGKNSVIAILTILKYAVTTNIWNKYHTINQYVNTYLCGCA
jgi:hypothetical protein